MGELFLSNSGSGSGAVVGGGKGGMEGGGCLLQVMAWEDELATNDLQVCVCMCVPVCLCAYVRVCSRSWLGSTR